MEGVRNAYESVSVNRTAVCVRVCQVNERGREGCWGMKGLVTKTPLSGHCLNSTHSPLLPFKSHHTHTTTQITPHTTTHTHIYRRGCCSSLSSPPTPTTAPGGSLLHDSRKRRESCRQHAPSLQRGVRSAPAMRTCGWRQHGCR